MYPRPKERYEQFRLNPESPLYTDLNLAILCGREDFANRYVSDNSPAARRGAFASNPTDARIWSRELNRHVLACQYAAGGLSFPAARFKFPVFMATWFFYTGTFSSGQLLTLSYSNTSPISDGVRLDVNNPGYVAITFSNVKSYAFYTLDVPQETWTFCAVYCPGNNSTAVGYRSKYGQPIGTEQLTVGSMLGSPGTIYTGYRHNNTLDYLIADGMSWNRILSDAEVRSIADPSNVDLRVGDVPLIIPQRPRLWGVAIAVDSVQHRTPWHLLIQGVR